METMIYLDHAATTGLAPEAFEAMLPYLREEYGNPSAGYTMAFRAKKGILESRKTVAETLGALPEEIYFTSGGTESDNWAIRAAAQLSGKKGRHLITTKVEHHAVLGTCKMLEREGFQVTYLDVDEYGMISLRQLEAAIRSDTILISIMYANNEVGTIQPIREAAKLASKHGILFHTDAVQAYGHVPMRVGELGVDLLSASAHKFHGPKGVGFLYVRKGISLPPFLCGGGQEMGLRSGTENVAGIVGLGAAARLAAHLPEEKQSRISQCADYMRERLTREIPGIVWNGHPEKRLPGHINVSIAPLEAESVLVQLDLAGICASGGSACATGRKEASHVLLAMGRTPEQAKGALRFTLSEENTLEEIDRTVDVLKDIVEKMRRMMGWQEGK